MSGLPVGTILPDVSYVIEYELRAGDHIVDRQHAIHTVDSVLGDDVRLARGAGSVKRWNVRVAVTHNVPQERPWYAAEVGRSIEICDKQTRRVLATYQPPHKWKDRWVWNVTSDGFGIYFAIR
ncbi:MAG: hypothetical protein SF069_11760 [Phycisphaerae bacterium]|nr:hypothetical protein [Phycisphaerae bacterium]